MPIRVALAARSRRVLEQLADSCSHGKDFKVVDQVTTGKAALDVVQCCRPDILLLDLRIKATDATTTLAQLRRLGDSIRTRVVALTDTKADAGLQALLLGAHGVASMHAKSASLVQCIRDTHAGGKTVDPDFAMDALANMVGQRATIQKLSETLSRRQLRRQKAAIQKVPATLSQRQLVIARLTADGLSNPEIAQRLAITRASAEGQLRKIYKKLELRNGRAGLQGYLQDKGLLLHPKPAVAQATKPLSKRQLEIARLSAEGLGTTAIAHRLEITQGAVSTQLHHTFRKLKLRRSGGPHLRRNRLRQYLRDNGLD